jgi:8-oxo-dGTP pyrophosphatase MutT (NUDIX family)
MPKSDSAAGVIVFHNQPDDTPAYLIIKNSENYWEFPKGHPHPGETWKQTARRELEEETGIYDIELIPSFSRQIRYFYRDGRKRIIDKTVCFALAQTGATRVVLSHEHSQGEFLPFEKAMRKLTHAGTRALLRDADEFIKQHLSTNAAIVEFKRPPPNNGYERKSD